MPKKAVITSNYIVVTNTPPPFKRAIIKEVKAGHANSISDWVKFHIIRYFRNKENKSVPDPKPFKRSRRNPTRVPNVISGIIKITSVSVELKSKILVEIANNNNKVDNMSDFVNWLIVAHFKAKKLKNVKAN